MSQFYNDSVFWIEVDKIHPNPFQPRKEFDEIQLRSLSDSIKQYGVLQALVVTRKEIQKEDGGLTAEYELIAGERRLRAAKMAGLREVPVLIRNGGETDLMKLELAIIENIQREDLNPVDRAKAFDRLVTEFHFKHSQIAEKVGKSREYVTNSLRMLALPPEMIDALAAGKISEGHSRALLMLSDRPDEQNTVFKEVLYKKLTVRETESVARKIAYDRIRNKEKYLDPEIREMEERLAEALGTRVHIEKGEKGGKLSIDFFTQDDLRSLLAFISERTEKRDPNELLNKHISRLAAAQDEKNVPESIPSQDQSLTTEKGAPIDDRTPEEIKKEENEDLYSVKNFSL